MAGKILSESQPIGLRDVADAASGLPEFNQIEPLLSTLSRALERRYESQRLSNETFADLFTSLVALRSIVRGHEPMTSLLVGFLESQAEVIPEGWSVDILAGDEGSILESRIARKHRLSAMPYAEYLASREWAIKRSGAVNRAGSRCQLCNSDRPPLHVHHRTYERRGYELDSDLIALCAECHSIFHDRLPKEKPWWEPQ